MGGMTGADRSYHWGGGVPPFSEREINVEFEAGALVNKALADVVKEGETIDANILKGKPYGRNQSEANKPTLEFPLMSLRLKLEGGEGADDTVKRLQERLNGMLPKDVREKLSQEMSLPETQRNPAYAALEKSLAYAAAALAILNQASKSFEGQSIVLRYAQQNLEFTEQALQALIKQGKELLREGYASLKQLGRNHPHFDILLKHLKNAADSLRLLKQISDEDNKNKQQEQGKEEEEEEEEKHSQKKKKTPFEEALKKTELYAKHYRESFTGDQLLLIGPLLQAISLMGKTESLNDGLRSVLFGLLFYQIGSEGTPSMTFPIGEGTTALIDHITDLLNEMCLSDRDPKSKDLFPALTKACAILCVTGSIYLFSTHIHHEVLGESIVEDEEEHLTESEETVVNTFTLWNLIAMCLHVNFIQRFIPDNAFDSKYGLTNPINVVTHTIELTIISIVIRAVKQMDEDASNFLLNGLKQSLIQRTVTLENLIDRIDADNARSIGWSDEQRKSLAVQLTNCRIVLQNERYDQWYNHWDQVTIALGMKSENIDREIKKFYDQAHLYQTLFNENIEDFSNAITGIVQI